MEKFLESGYDINGEKYYSFEQIGEYFFPEKDPFDAKSKVRYIYKYRRKDLEQYTTRTKCWWSNQTIVVLSLRGVRVLCEFIKRSDRNEKLGNFIKCINFS